MFASVRDRLTARLRKTERGFSRENPEMKAIAKLAGLSIHTVQSAAMQRRELTSYTEPRIREAIMGRRYVKS
jgi:hypothetical protein